MLRFSLLLNFLLAAALAAGVYLFMVRGNVAPASDGRTAVIVEPGERDLILAEMRHFLEAVQEIVEAAGKEDMAAVAKAAHSVGSTVAEGVPPALMGKLPLEFKTLGLATHKAFDELEAAAPGGRAGALAALGAILNNCTTCHGGYRLDTPVRK
jgi:hypothetical protein